jgi:hypothetical protein
VDKSRNPKTVEEERKAREELQNPDMEKFDRAMRALVKVKPTSRRTHKNSK